MSTVFTQTQSAHTSATTSTFVGKVAFVAGGTSLVVHGDWIAQ
jgi:hypothetical protein